ncbi:tripartite tricarboxylate transporter TctB family protein [Devosia sp. 919]|uniref:tripartite tricarboxylate transporter TctB family protein n=1 Tax=Devosia sp. 919 TaxID=2726065 RepID=UPI001553F704
MAELEQLATSFGGTLPLDETIAEPDYSAAPSRRLEIAIAVTALMLSLLALWLSRNIILRMGGGGVDPKWWPTLLSVLAAGLAAILVGMSFLAPPMSRGEVEATEKDGWIRMLVALTLSAIYVFAWSTIGYVIPTLVFTAALLFLFGLRSWKGLVIFSLATTAFIYGLFHYLLKVPL